MKPLCLAALIGLWFARFALCAEIYEWTDAGGARHFTNRKDLVPAERRAALKVVVAAGEQAKEEAVDAAAAPHNEEPSAQIVVTGTRAGWQNTYEAGLRDGQAMASGGAGTGGQVSIVGPLAVASIERPAASAYPIYAPWPFYDPFVTTSFDRGRSRHLTMRMLLQDQFQLDRDGPFVYQRLNPPGLGPNLQPVLPRGLPRHFARGGRVLFR
jgi:hypothetical protein